MLHPTFEEMQDKICKDTDDKENIENSRFAIIIGVSRRARQLVDIDNKKMEKEGIVKVEYRNGKRIETRQYGEYQGCKKYLSTAIDEVYNGDIHIIDGGTNRNEDDNIKYLF